MIVQYDQLAEIWAERIWARDRQQLMALPRTDDAVRDHVLGALGFMDPSAEMLANVCGQLETHISNERARNAKPADDRRAAARLRLNSHRERR